MVGRMSCWPASCASSRMMEMVFAVLWQMMISA
jgi:hypothetical protein